MNEREWLSIRESFWAGFEKTYGVKPGINCPKCGDLPQFESFNHSDSSITINYSFKCSYGCGHEFNKTVVYKA